MPVSEAKQALKAEDRRPGAPMPHRPQRSLQPDESESIRYDLSRSDIVSVSPSTLLPDEDYRRKRLASEHTLPHSAPSSLLGNGRRARGEGPRESDVAAVSPSSLLPDEDEHRRRLAGQDRPPQYAPSTLLAGDTGNQARALRQPDVTALSPSSLLPDEDHRWSRLAAQDQLSQKAPSSLLPETLRATPRVNQGPEVVAVSPRDLLASDAHARAPGAKRPLVILSLCAAVAACLLVLFSSRVDVSRFVTPSAEDSQPTAERVQSEELRERGYSIEALQKRVELQPDDAAARYALGQGHYSDGHFQRAEAEFRKALELGFDRPKSTTALASSLLLQGDFEKVLEESGSGSDWPADVVAELSALRGLALLGLARTADAERLFDRVLETHPQQTLALVGKARIAASRDNREEAKRLGELVSRHGKSTSESLALRAQLRWVLDKADEARSPKQVEPGSQGNAASQVRE